MELEAAPQLPRRDARKLVRCPRLQLDAKTVTAVEQSTGTPVADAAATSPGGATRVKILLSKQQLKQPDRSSAKAQEVKSRRAHTAKAEREVMAYSEKYMRDNLVSNVYALCVYVIDS
ncbi:hypothetical protein TRIUR3_17590 [Triticum urartu]|uniref:Uncharacterized protein n=1 Tax=Triticum urartu TaxID=4572 RepID=M7YTI7_TRIUA|nr:hypothetical protein TRIUR3_17590 [Triticum urartu]